MSLKKIEGVIVGLPVKDIHELADWLDELSVVIYGMSKSKLMQKQDDWTKF
jgi:hypothetical protein